MFNDANVQDTAIDTTDASAPVFNETKELEQRSSGLREQVIGAFLAAGHGLDRKAAIARAKAFYFGNGRR